jgi:hypothetical protein
MTYYSVQHKHKMHRACKEGPCRRAYVVAGAGHGKPRELHRSCALLWGGAQSHHVPDDA